MFHLLKNKNYTSLSCYIKIIIFKINLKLSDNLIVSNLKESLKKEKLIRGELIYDSFDLIKKKIKKNNKIKKEISLVIINQSKDLLFLKFVKIIN